MAEKDEEQEGERSQQSTQAKAARGTSFAPRPTPPWP